MKKYNKNILLFICLFCAVLLVGCTKQAIARYPYDYIVYMDGNGGDIGNYKYRNYYVLENSPILAPGSGNIPEAVRAEYHLLGWFRGTKLENGEIEFGEEWDFTNDRVTEDMTLYAKWELNYTFKIVYGNNFSSSTTVGDFQNKDGVITRPNIAPVVSGKTFYDFYSDPECTTLFEFGRSYDFIDETGAEIKNINIYAKYLDFSCIIVRSAADMINVAPNGVYYLDNDIDFTGRTVNWPYNDFSGEIIGNGYKLMNIDLNLIQERRVYSFGLFRTLSGANIHDVTFENCNVTFTCGSDTSMLYFGFLTGGANGEVTTLTNVDFTNCALKVNLDKTNFNTDLISVSRLVNDLEKIQLNDVDYETIDVSITNIR